MSRDIPIIFSASMVRALLDGRKIMTRRLTTSPLRNAAPGDRLWVRENFSKYDYRDGCWYWADGRIAAYDAERPRPSIHMPRWASRLTLIVIATKIERLQDISEADAQAEGWTRHPEISNDPEVHRDAAKDWFSDLWGDLHGVESWKANPEVVAISFKTIKANIDAPEAVAA